MPRQDPPAARQPAAAPSEVAPGLGRVPGLVSWARTRTADPLRQLRPGPRRQIVARLPADRRRRLVPGAVPDPSLGATAGDVRIRNHGPGLPARHLGRRRADRARRRHHYHRRSLETRGGAVAGPAAGGERLVRPHPLQSAQRHADGCYHPDHAPAARRRFDGPCAGAGGLGNRAPSGDRRG